MEKKELGGIEATHNKIDNHNGGHGHHHGGHAHHHGVHGHHHDLDGDHDEASKNISLAFLINLLFAIFEVVGGLLTNSVAILSDAVHDFGDALSLAVAWYLQKVSKKRADYRFSYGYKRFSLLGSIFISLVIVVGGLFILWESIKRLRAPQETHGLGMALMAIIGIVVHLVMVLRLKKGTSHNERAVYLHMMEDLLGWLAVLIGGIVMHIWHLPFIDPLLSVGIVVWLLYNVYRNLTETITILLQEVPKEIDYKEVKEELLAIESVDSLHHLHLWTIDGQKHIMTVHLVLEDGMTIEEVTAVKESARLIAGERGIVHTTIEVESKSNSHNCYLYNNPC